VSRTAARFLKARQHEEQALELRLSGASYAQIGEALGMTAGGTFKAVERALARQTAETNEKAEKLRRFEVARLDRLLMGIWPRARSGDEKAARAGRIDAEQAQHELSLLQGMLKAAEQTTLEEKLDRIEAALDARRS
jgi:LPS O-antigen subunit length determinant protein (WzzB/FepE family)